MLQTKPSKEKVETLRIEGWRDVRDLLACPRCKSPLSLKENSSESSLVCKSEECLEIFPLVESRPVLICNERSLFSTEMFLEGKDHRAQEKWKTFLLKFIPSLSNKPRAKKLCSRLADLLPKDKRALVLVIGSGEEGEGIGELERHARILNCDVNHGKNVHLIADGHDLPLKDSSIDAILVQSVLEHVLDPKQVVSEIFRVLRPKGLVLADTPQTQQVHEGEYDYTRFTCLGQRWLFKNFELIDMGASCGPGMSLAWAYEYFLRSLFKSRLGRRFASLFAHCTAFWLKWLDPLLLERPAAIDAASQCYFLGRKSESPISEKELLRDFPGVDVWQKK